MLLFLILLIVILNEVCENIYINSSICIVIGNVIDPIDTIESVGCDALRYALVTGSTPGQDIPLSMEKIEGSR